SDHVEICERFGHRCEWLRPFANSAGEVVGLIGLCGPEPGAPNDEVRRMLETAARFTGVALQGRETNEALRRNEERFRTYFDSCMIGIAISDNDTYWIELNDRFAEILGYKKEELIGKSWVKHTHPDDLAACLAWVEAAAVDPTKRSQIFKKRFIRADGSTAETELYSGVVHKPDGDVDYYVTLVQDVTERNRANRELRRRDEMLKHYDRLASMGAMAAEIAHEIVQPLSTLSMLSESLEVKLRRQEASVSEDIIASIEKIKNVAVNAARVTQGITRFARGHGKSPECVVLGDLIQRTLELLESDLERHKVDWTVEHQAAEAIVFVEEVLIQQVIVNLVRNAANAMEANEGERRLVVRTRWLENSIIEVEVADNGPGVDSEKAKGIFEAFVSYRNEGVGLGLAICKSVIASHDGSIRVHKSDLGGSSFRFTLPTSEEI
ncbi:MAG: PAS domain S-box protein, partial [bacterium]|nr:PAS domain S-box protein [bacterium]